MTGPQGHAAERHVRDVIVVGARCAGAATALLLARRGYDVLLVDRDALPSDMPHSTHLVWPPGVAALRRWGLHDWLAARCPPITDYLFDLGAFALRGPLYPSGDVAHSFSPRRFTLDRALLEAATAAGAELRDATTCEGVVVENGRVAGVRLRTAAGGSATARARIVVGADGPYSIVARSVGAREREAHPVQQVTVWTYWSGVPLDGFEGYPRPWRMAYAWKTEGDLALVGVNWPLEDFRHLTGARDAAYFAVLDDAAPGLAARLRGGRREEPWLRGSCRGFLRDSSGPGWALVGDAGYLRDPCTAQGITDAFRDAESLADAIDVGLTGQLPLEAALGRYVERRDEFVRPFAAFTAEAARFAPPSEDMARVYAAIAQDRGMTERFFGVFAQTVSPAEFFAPRNVEQILRGAD